MQLRSARGLLGQCCRSSISHLTSSSCPPSWMVSTFTTAQPTIVEEKSSHHTLEDDHSEPRPRQRARSSHALEYARHKKPTRVRKHLSVAKRDLPDPCATSVGRTVIDHRMRDAKEPATRWPSLSDSQPTIHNSQDAQTTARSRKRHVSKSSPSVKTLRRYREVPSNLLDSALLEAGYHFAVPKTIYHDKVDLSLVAPRKINDLSPEQRNTTHRSRHANDETIMTLKGHIASYIRASRNKNLSELGQSAPSEVSPTAESFTSDSTFFSSAEADWFKKRGYNPNDVPLWVRVLTSENLSENLKDTMLRKRIPTAILLHFLRRNHISYDTLRFLLEYTWTHLQGKRTLQKPNDLDSEGSESNSTLEVAVGDFTLYSAVDDQSIFILFVRFLRHARRVWPEAMPQISRIIPLYLHRYNEQDDLTDQRNERYAKLTDMYNRAIALLSIPSSIRPLMSSVYQEWAQFDLLRAMSEHRPAISVTREGYRGITRLQLYRRKTNQERDWVSLQARSWPPWKEDRTGLDEDKDIAYGTSKAATVISRMMEAGYFARNSENIARIIAGWDLDGSPTVPTRMYWSRLRNHSVDENVWIARMNTTRTVREAWACFLSYKDSGANPIGQVYVTMICKLLMNEKRIKEDTSGLRRKESLHTLNDRGSLGERLEPFEEPISPLEVTYVRTPPPDPISLFDEMVDVAGIRLSIPMLDRLLSSARSIAEGKHFITRCEHVSGPLLSMLSSNNLALNSHVPDRTLAILIQLLCRYPDEALDLKSEKLEPDPLPDFFPWWQVHWRHPIPQALRIVLLHRPTYRPSWNYVLRALSDWGSGKWVFRLPKQKPGRTIRTIIVVRRLLEEMNSVGLELDMEGFRHVCKCFENDAIERRSWKTLREWPESRTPNEEDPAWQRLCEESTSLQSSMFLRHLFQRVVSRGHDNRVEEVDHHPELTWPSLVETPTAHDLHGYIRALGVLGDHEGIWSLVQWMVEHKDALSVMQKESYSGIRRMRKTLTGIRVFMEYPHMDRLMKSAELDAEVKPAAEELIALVEEHINNVHEWGGWPTSEEVMRYIDSNTVF